MTSGIPHPEGAPEVGSIWDPVGWVQVPYTPASAVMPKARIVVAVPRGPRGGWWVRWVNEEDPRGRVKLLAGALWRAWVIRQGVVQRPEGAPPYVLPPRIYRTETALPTEANTYVRLLTPAERAQHLARIDATKRVTPTPIEEDDAWLK